MARIVTLAHSPAVTAPPARDRQHPAAARCQIWRGASGRNYRHFVYGLVECPPLARGVYVLARRAPDSSVTALHVSVGQNDAATMNLARMRQRGAQLGANEVHVYFAARTEHARMLATCDLRAGQFGQLGPERAAAQPRRPGKH